MFCAVPLINTILSSFGQLHVLQWLPCSTRLPVTSPYCSSNLCGRVMLLAVCPCRMGLVLEWVYGSIVSTAEKSRDGAKRQLGLHPPTTQQAYQNLIGCLEDQAVWEQRAKQVGIGDFGLRCVLLWLALAQTILSTGDWLVCWHCVLTLGCQLGVCTFQRPVIIGLWSLGS